MNTNNYINTLLDGLTNYTKLGINESQEMIRARQLTNEEVSKNPNFKNLYAVLETVGQVTKGNSHQNKLRHSFKINPLSLEKAIFAEQNGNKGNVDDLLEDFTKYYDILNSHLKEEALAYSYFHLLYQYGSRIAFEAHKDTTKTDDLKSDVSLFDRNRILAGITTCLEEPNLNKEKPFLLVKGDLSGIQGFIYYDIVQDVTESGGGKRIAKKLRGRSFYVALFTQFLAEEIVESLGLMQSNIIFAGGGHFNLVLPNTPEINQQLEKLEKKINIFIRNKVGSSLSLILGIQPCGEGLFDIKNQKENDNTAHYYDKMNHVLEMARQRKHQAYLSDIFHPNDAKGEDLKRTKKVLLKGDKELGEKIPYSNCMIEIKLEANQRIVRDNDKLNPDLTFIDFDKYLFFNKPKDEDEYPITFIISTLEKYKKQIKSAKVIMLNNTSFVSEDLTINLNNLFDFPIAFGFQFIGKEAPKNDDGSLMDFSEIAALDWSKKDEFNKEYRKLGYTQLAAMRLDVDDLGAIFTSGLEPMSFQRVASLSREFHLFFSGYFNILAEKYQIYIVYSGGDDAFVVGSWYNMIHFAKELYEDFKRFTCNNDKVHFSAGIFLCHETYPVARFANDAAKLEKLAKEYTGTDEKNKEAIKNAIHVFDHTLSWENFVSKVDFAKKMIKHTNEEGIKEKDKLARSLVHKLSNLISSSVENNRISPYKLSRNTAMLHYLFTKHGFNHQEIKEKTKKVTQDIIVQILEDFRNNSNVHDYIIATSYVLLKTRKNSN